MICLAMGKRRLLAGRGFSSIEILLVVVLIGILAGVSLPLSRFVQERNDLDLAAMATAQTLRKAKVYTETSRLDASWGVRVGSGDIILFQGDDYLTRDPGYDEIFTLGSKITASGQTETVFSGLPATPQASGTLKLTTGRGKTAPLSITPSGMITY